VTRLLIESTEQLIHYFQQGEKKPDSLLIGTEHEQLLFFKDTKTRVPYDGERGIRSILEAFVAQGWKPILEKNQPIALLSPDATHTISLEPGGQFELSGAPLPNLHDSYDELTSYLQQLDLILTTKSIDRLGVGFDPISKRQDVPWMPKQRYKIMRDYMPTKGNHGLDMMTRTCTIQVNLDYVSEQDFVHKMRVAMGLQPILSALFATSSVVEGKDSGYKSYRNFIWLDTDPDRCGLLPFVFDENMGYARYVEYLLDIPMYYINYQGQMLVSGQPFRDFLDKKLAVLPGKSPTRADWVHHISMTFPEVRLKRYLELRSADCGDDSMILALSALWVGILYDAENLKMGHDYIRTLPFSTIHQVYSAVPKQGLATLLQDEPIGHLARQWVEKSKEGLCRRRYLNAKGQDETIYLEPLFAILEKEGY
jgi:glutamate--cysteine ligase